ncbi:MAG: hypothetical protein CM15mP38_3060 [Synechococcus sp.]|nr:MAG: hypothetical protein CM15mP38_3060 [Synechococcus sp.]
MRLTSNLFPPLSGATQPLYATLQALRLELLPYLLLPRWRGDVPNRGYAGFPHHRLDFPVSQEVLASWASPWIVVSLNQPAAKAVRNRRGLLGKGTSRALTLTDQRQSG